MFVQVLCSFVSGKPKALVGCARAQRSTQLKQERQATSCKDGEGIKNQRRAVLRRTDVRLIILFILIKLSQ